MHTRKKTRQIAKQNKTHTNNSYVILEQILDIIGSKANGKERYIDDFLTLVQVDVMAGLIQSLPKDKHKHIIDQFTAMPDAPEKLFLHHIIPGNTCGRR